MKHCFVFSYLLVALSLKPTATEVGTSGSFGCLCEKSFCCWRRQHPANKFSTRFAALPGLSPHSKRICDEYACPTSALCSLELKPLSLLAKLSEPKSYCQNTSMSAIYATSSSRSLCWLSPV